jgi:hypothetical protein
MQGRGHGDRLPRRYELAIASLLSESTIAAAAARTGVAEATLARWLRRPDLQTAFRAARRQVVEVAVAQLQAATSEAVQTLCRNLKAESSP